MSKYEQSNTHKTEIRQYAHVKGLPQWKYCPLKQVCITGIIHTVGECWQKLENATQIITTTHKHSPKCCLGKAWYRVEPRFFFFFFFLRCRERGQSKALQRKILSALWSGDVNRSGCCQNAGFLHCSGDIGKMTLIRLCAAQKKEGGRRRNEREERKSCRRALG